MSSLLLALGMAFSWPEGKRAAVSLAYDDAINSQLDNAIPALDRHRLKASFYLTLSSETLVMRLPEWRAAAANGHELGNHTLFHQCSRSAPDRKWVSVENDLDHTSAAQLAAQIRVGNAMLHAIDGKTRRTFTVPCGDLKAAGENYLPLVTKDFVAIKSGGGPVIADMQALDPYSVPVLAPSEVTGAELIARVDEAIARGTMVNFTFHGIGADYLTVSAQAHEQLLGYLDTHRDQVWTDTFINIMGYVKDQRSSKPGR